jgi:hypothetical protein
LLKSPKLQRRAATRLHRQARAVLLNRGDEFVTRSRHVLASVLR